MARTRVWSSSLAQLKSDLRARRTAAVKANPRSLGVMAAPPTVSVSTTAPSAPYAAMSVTGLSSYDGIAKFCGGYPVMNGSFAYTLGATKTVDLATRAASSTDGYQTSNRIVFYADGDKVVFRISISQLTMMRFIVDGQYVDLTGVTAGVINTNHYVTLDFTAVGGAKPRRVEVELQGGSATSGGSIGVQQFGPIYKTPLQRIWVPSDEEIGPRLLIAGDSYTYGPVAGQVTTTMQGDGFARYLGDLLGLSDTWASGVAGTGWLARSSGGTFPDLLNRVSDITLNAPDVVLIPMGINENILFGNAYNGITISNATIQARVTLTLQTIRVALPGVPVIVTGPFKRNSGTEAARAQGIETAISDGVAALADGRIKFVPTIATNFFDGTGHSGATNGSGNSDVYLSSDQTHLTIAGHAYAAQRLVQPFLTSIESMV